MCGTINHDDNPAEMKINAFMKNNMLTIKFY